MPEFEILEYPSPGKRSLLTVTIIKKTRRKEKRKEKKRRRKRVKKKRGTRRCRTPLAPSRICLPLSPFLKRKLLSSRLFSLDSRLSFSFFFFFRTGKSGADSRMAKCRVPGFKASTLPNFQSTRLRSSSFVPILYLPTPSGFRSAMLSSQTQRSPASPSLHPSSTPAQNDSTQHPNSSSYSTVLLLVCTLVADLLIFFLPLHSANPNPEYANSGHLA